MPANTFTTTNGVIWTGWCGNNSTMATTSSITLGSTNLEIWQDWCTTGTSTANSVFVSDNQVIVTGINETVWVNWIQAGTTVSNLAVRSVLPRHGSSVISEEEVARRAAETIARRAQWDIEAKAERALREVAEEKARKLLVENLSLRQRLEFEKHGHFVVEGKQHRFRIRKGGVGNVDVVDREGKIVHRLCAHARIHVPDHDNMLIQKLLLEDDEDAFVKIANRHPSYDKDAVLEALH